MVFARSRALVFAVAVFFSVGCDSASGAEDCTVSTDPVEGGAGRCPPSAFPAEQELARGAVGRVVAGTQFAPGALVRIDPTPGFPNARTVPPLTTFTDDGGIYRFPTAALRYDLMARVDRDVTFYSGVGGRYLEPVFDREIPQQAWTTTLRPVIRGVQAGNKLAFFVSGVLALGISGEDPDAGLTVSFREFGSTLSIHAVEYPPGADIGAAVAHGMREVTLRAGEAQFPEITLEPVKTAVDFVIDPVAPPGFAREKAEIVVDFGLRTNERVLAHVAPGASVRIPLFLGARYFVRATATLDGAVSHSGRHLLDLRLGRYADVLPDPPTELAPPDGTQIVEGALLRARAIGITEHLLVPVSGDGPTLRIVTADKETPIPDVQTMGLPHLFGRYRWTVRSFRDLRFVEGHGGIDASVATAYAYARPREIVF